MCRLIASVIHRSILLLSASITLARSQTGLRELVWSVTADYATCKVIVSTYKFIQRLPGASFLSTLNKTINDYAKKFVNPCLLVG